MSSRTVGTTPIEAAQSIQSDEEPTVTRGFLHSREAQSRGRGQWMNYKLGLSHLSQSLIGVDSSLDL